MTDDAEAGRIARGCHHDSCDLAPCATCPYAAARHAAAEVDAVDLADRLAEAFPLPSDIVPALRRIGMRVAGVGFLRTPVETWVGILRAVEGGGAAWRVNRPLALADFEALLLRPAGDWFGPHTAQHQCLQGHTWRGDPSVEGSNHCPWCEDVEAPAKATADALVSGPATGDPWRTLALKAIRCADADDEWRAVHARRAAGALIAERDALLAAGRDS